MTSSDRTHSNRARAESFGATALAYDQARPDYPPAVIDELVATAPAQALDIGCGTGKLARLLAARGVDVLGVEIDERMAAVARDHGLSVDVAPFETWDARGARFDLLVAGQAWHWIDASVGIPKAADLLRPGGRLALLWNYPSFDAVTQTALDRAYRSAAPDFSEQSVLRGGGPATVPTLVSELRDSGRFNGVEHRRYRWTQLYSREEWLALISTHSDHLVLPPEQLSRVLDAVGAAIESLGGSLATEYVTEAVLADVG